MAHQFYFLPQHTGSLYWVQYVCVRESCAELSFLALPVSVSVEALDCEVRLRPFASAVLCLLSPTTSARSFQIRFCRASACKCVGFGLQSLSGYRLSVSISVSVFRFSPFGFSATRGRVRPVPDLGKQRYVSERPSPLSIPVNHHIVVVVAKIGSLSSFSLQCCAPYCLRYANYRKDSNRCVHYRLQSLWQDDV